MAHRVPSQSQLIEEYKATQEMIRHMDNLRWYAGFVMFAGIAAVTGLVSRAPDPGDLYPLLFFFSVLTLCPWYYWYLKLRTWILQKYRRLGEIEETLGFHQHRYCQQQEGTIKLLKLPADLFPGTLACGIPSFFLILWLRWWSLIVFVIIIIISMLAGVYCYKLKSVGDFIQAIRKVFPKHGVTGMVANQRKKQRTDKRRGERMGRTKS